MKAHVAIVALVLMAMAPWLVACEEEPSAAERAYLASFCEALDDFSDRVVVTSSPDSVAGAFDALVVDLEAMAPPPSLHDFHAAFAGYVREAAGQPREVASREVPRPPSDVRSRLASIEHEVPGCRAPTPFEAGS